MPELLWLAGVALPIATRYREDWGLHSPWWLLLLAVVLSMAVAVAWQKVHQATQPPSSGVGLDRSGHPSQDHNLDVADGPHVAPLVDAVQHLHVGAKDAVLTDDEVATWLLLHDLEWTDPVGPATAQIVVVQRNVNLRRDPSTRRAPIRLLTPPTEAELLEPEKTAGYYHVRTSEGEEGWVWGSNVQVGPLH